MVALCSCHGRPSGGRSPANPLRPASHASASGWASESPGGTMCAAAAVRTAVRAAERVSRRTAVLGAFAAVVSGCVPLPGHRQLSRRFVAQKAAENTLVSDDGASCEVAADRFAAGAVGDRYACAWQYPAYTRPPAGSDASAPARSQPQGSGRKPGAGISISR